MTPTINGWAIFWGLVLGILGYFVAQLVFNEVISALIGIVIAAAIIFGGSRNRLV